MISDAGLRELRGCLMAGRYAGDDCERKGCCVLVVAGVGYAAATCWSGVALRTCGQHHSYRKHQMEIELPGGYKELPI
jgi:hypothetical protein